MGICKGMSCSGGGPVAAVSPPFDSMSNCETSEEYGGLIRTVRLIILIVIAPPLPCTMHRVLSYKGYGVQDNNSLLVHTHQI